MCVSLQGQHGPPAGLYNLSQLMQSWPGNDGQGGNQPGDGPSTSGRDDPPPAMGNQLKRRASPRQPARLPSPDLRRRAQAAYDTQQRSITPDMGGDTAATPDHPGDGQADHGRARQGTKGRRDAKRHAGSPTTGTGTITAGPQHPSLRRATPLPPVKKGRRHSRERYRDAGGRRSRSHSSGPGRGLWTEMSAKEHRAASEYGAGPRGGRTSRHRHPSPHTAGNHQHRLQAPASNTQGQPGPDPPRGGLPDGAQHPGSDPPRGRGPTPVNPQPDPQLDQRGRRDDNTHQVYGITTQQHGKHRRADHPHVCTVTPTAAEGRGRHTSPAPVTSKLRRAAQPADHLSNKSRAPDQPPANPTGPDHPTDEQVRPLKLAPTPEDTTPVVTYFYSTVGDKIRQTVTRVPFRHSWEVKPRGDGWEPCGYTPCIDFSRRADFTAWAKTHKEVNP